MKLSIILLLPLTFLLSAFQSPLSAQERSKKIDTLEFRVEGVCDQCKMRIENASLIKGVKFSEWEKETQMMKVIYRNDKVSEEDIHRAISEAGHDTDKMKANEKAYEKLPRCCEYKNGVHVH